MPSRPFTPRMRNTLLLTLFLVFSTGCSLLPPMGAGAGAAVGAAVGGPAGAATGALVGHIGGTAAQESMEEDPAVALAQSGLSGAEISDILRRKDESFSDKIFRLIVWVVVLGAVLLFLPPLQQWPGGIKKWIARHRSG